LRAVHGRGSGADAPVPPLDVEDRMDDCLQYRKNRNEVVKHIRIICLLPLVSFLLGGVSSGQEAAPELELEEYQIIGKDTRVFEITGDRLSTVAFRAFPLELPEEERSVETSQGLIANEERLRREETFGSVHGPYFQADVTAGIPTIGGVWGKGSMDAGTVSGTLELMSRQAEENTPNNAAPSISGFLGAGYYERNGTVFSGEIGFSGEDEELFGKKFRPRRREAGRFKGGVSMRTVFRENWDVTGGLKLEGGDFRDAEIPYDESELNIRGKLAAVGDVYDVTVVSDVETAAFGFAGVSGHFFSAGARGTMLLADNLGLRLGARIYATGGEGADSRTRLYPEAGLNWAPAESWYFKASYAPRVTGYSHGDIYDRNGLVEPSAPMLFEDRKFHAAGELGRRFERGSLAVRIFREKCENPLLFNRFGDFFSVPAGKDLSVTGVDLTARYDRDGEWGFDGEITLNDASLGGGGDVPFLPSVEAAVRGFWAPVEKWVVRGELNVTGRRTVETGSDDTVGSFYVLDCSVEREFLGDYRFYCRLRNVTNSGGSWWTEEYEIPGIGLLAGVRVNR